MLNGLFIGLYVQERNALSYKTVFSTCSLTRGALNDVGKIAALLGGQSNCGGLQSHAISAPL